MYKKYSNLLDNTAEQQITSFLSEKRSLAEFIKVDTAFHLQSTLSER